MIACTIFLVPWYNQAMGDFNRGGRGRGRDFGRRGFAGGSGRGGDRSMHKAICSRCGNECEVPFRPTGEKPVFCSRCFEENNQGGDSRRFGGRDSPRGSFSDKQMFDAVCDSCGNKCSVPFHPTSGKPIYCSKCFEEKEGKGPRGGGQPNVQLDTINAKLDKILKILSPEAPVKVVKEEKAAVEEKLPEIVKEVKKPKKVKKTVKKASPTKKE